MEELEKLIYSYEPNQATIDLISSIKVALLAGISGAGKNTIMERLANNSSYHQIVSHTTRKIRQNGGVWEQDGIDYHFIDEKEAVRMLNDHEFVEAKFVHGDTVYGTSIAEFQQAKDQNQVAVTDIDVQGVSEYVKLSSRVLPIFIVPPSYDEWIDRLKARYESEAEFQIAWPKRKQSAIVELKESLEKGYYYFVINDKIESAVEDINRIVHGEQPRNQDAARQIVRELIQKLTQN